MQSFLMMKVTQSTGFSNVIMHTYALIIVHYFYVTIGSCACSYVFITTEDVYSYKALETLTSTVSSQIMPLGLFPLAIS